MTYLNHDTFSLPLSHINPVPSDHLLMAIVNRPLQESQVLSLLRETHTSLAT